MNLEPLLLVEQNDPMVVIHADDVLPNDWTKSFEGNAAIGRALHFVVIETLPSFEVKLHGLKRPKFVHGQNVQMSIMSESIRFANTLDGDLGQMQQWR